MTSKSGSYILTLQHGGLILSIVSARASITIDERDRKDYFAPPSDLFDSYCSSIAERYDLESPGLIQQGNLLDLDYDYVPEISADQKVFTVCTDKTKYFAKSVVLSVGAGNSPSIPKPFPPTGCPCSSHAFQLARPAALEQRLRERKETNVLVIGGGLTSAQVSDRAIRQGVKKVVHVMRGPMKGMSGQGHDTILCSDTEN